ncbi:MAG: DUF4260 domain-containing protein [Ferruginibacter sp.]|nr:DUF4260 domain-containing protein [Ferruginibacter sp.]
MKVVLKLEEVAMAAMGIYLLRIYNLGLPIWLWAIIFFSPDISMLGYLINTKMGAICYNIFHHKGIAILVAVIGFYLHADVMLSIGILLFAHASFDRVFGYGLKHFDGFKNTHLGSLEKK